MVEVGILPNNGHRFQFAAWSERRYANNVNWEFRLKVRIEGIPVHCWAEELAAKALGKTCTAVHYLEETTRRRSALEVQLTVTEPDRGHPHHDEPVDIKRGQVYILRNHLEVVEDLTFLQEPGRIGGPANRKARRVFDWDYAVPDTKGEHLHGRRAGHDRGRDMRPRRDDDDYDGRRNHGNRHHRSLSAWARNSRCRGGAEDCISSNRWRGRGESPPQRNRPSGGAYQAPAQVWKVKEHKKEKAKRVSFADPIATELKPPKRSITDDSIMLTKGTSSSPIQIDDTDPVVADCVMLNSSYTVANSTTLSSNKEKEGGQDGHTTNNSFTSEQINFCDTRVTEPVTMPHVVNSDNTSAEMAEPEGMQGKDASSDYCGITPSEETSPPNITPNATDSSAFEVTANCACTDTATTPNTTPISSTEQEAGKDALADLGMVLGHLQDILTTAEFNQTWRQPTYQTTKFPLNAKAITNSGKGMIEIAKDLLIKKLGDLAGTDNTGANKPPIPDEFDLYAQHFARPVEKATMDAIQDLIEHGALIQKKCDNQGEAAAAPGLVA
ncbi:unnamed protein product [Miscanthus lutarioriparius]|uniref:DUF4283 domain-containing protein n=1 Tax=Miscanthus lutarioriparius TaxID=422564 RepID=A0A811QHN5_9POAL|nr:unnamed protein product [Miscanthus lutarioriparius]